MSDDPNALRYALAKQLQTAYAINSNYGTFSLDAEMRTAIEDALRPIILRRLRRLEKDAGDEVRSKK